MRRSQSEKMEIIRIIEGSEVSVKQSLDELGINRSTFYEWYRKYKEEGFDGLAFKPPDRKHFWNKIPDSEIQLVIETALDYPEKSPRELACFITDNQCWSISESSVYRILKKEGLITSPAYIVMAASDEFKDKTTGINQMWQTDFTYLKIIGWGWYYFTAIMDDYSRYIITWDLCKHMSSENVQKVINKALYITKLKANNRPRLLSDNGSCYISNDLEGFLNSKRIKHVRGAVYHPQTQGKIERYHRTMKNTIKLDNYYFPEELIRQIHAFVAYYNNERYHESLNNVTPADVYYRRDKEILERRKEIKHQTLIKRRKIYLEEKLSLLY